MHRALKQSRISRGQSGIWRDGLGAKTCSGDTQELITEFELSPYSHIWSLDFKFRVQHLFLGLQWR